MMSNTSQPNPPTAVALAAAMVVHNNPLVPPLAGLPAPVGTPLRELAPATAMPLMLRVNGQWLMRADWWRPVLPGDVIEWHVLPMGGNGNGSRQILTIIAIIVISYFVPVAGAALDLGTAGTAALGAGLTIAASALINALIPIQQPSVGSTQSPGSVYNVNTAANQARLAQPIPVIYGRMLTFPDFAAQPYAEYTNNDQYFFAVYCIGQGNFETERLQIDDTPLSHFQDVQYEILPPGALPTLALANVVSAPEVAGQTLLSGKRVGGFAACGPKFSAAKIGIDLVFPKGLGLANSSGNIGNLSVTVQADARYVDDFGVATGNWFALGYETTTRATSTPQRISLRYTLATPGRVEVRMTRVDVLNPSNNALHDVAWAGLRAYLSGTAALSNTASHLAIKIRASEQLSGLSQRKISGIWRRKVRTWSAGGGWGPEVTTRNPMWARLDKLTNTVYGDGLADSRIDLVTHAALAAVYETRQDRFDILFDAKVTSIDADRTICMAGRAVPFQRAGVCTIARDQLQTLPVTAFTSRNILPGSMSMRYALATEVTADAVIIEYFDNRSWDWREVLCKAPGVTSPVNAVRQRMMGVTGAKHAEREGLYLAAQNVYRRKFPRFSTEMQGLLPAYGSAVMFAPALPGWGQAGDVAYWDPVSLTMGCTEPLAFTTGAQHYVSVLRDDGSVTPAIAVTAGPTAYDLVLANAPRLVDDVTTMALVLDDATRERPKYVFGASGQHRIIVRVLGIGKKGRGKDGAPTIEISSVAEDVRVHAVDNALLPGPGEIQDPVSTDVDPNSAGTGSYTSAMTAAVAVAMLTPVSGVYTRYMLADVRAALLGRSNVTGYDTGGGSLYIVNLSDRLVSDDNNSALDTSCGFTLGNNGIASYMIAGVFTSLPQQWLLYGAADVTTTVLYEVRFTWLGTAGSAPTGYGTNYDQGTPVAPTGGDVMGVWLNLSTSRGFTLTLPASPAPPSALVSAVLVEIRLLGETTNQATQTITLHCQTLASGNAP